jgi:hypothetical protein
MKFKSLSATLIILGINSSITNSVYAESKTAPPNTECHDFNDKKIENNFSSLSSENEILHLNKDFIFSDVTYFYEKVSNKISLNHGKILSFKKEKNSNIPLKIELNNVKLHDKEKSRITNIKKIIATNLEEKNGILIPKNIEFIEFSSNYELLKTKVSHDNLIFKDLYLIEKNLYPVHIESNNSKTYSTKLSNEFVININKISYKNIKKINNTLIPSHYELKQLKISDYNKIIEKIKNKNDKELNSLIPTFKYFVEDFELSSYGEYDEKKDIFNSNIDLSNNKSSFIKAKIEATNFSNHEENLLKIAASMNDFVNKTEEELHDNETEHLAELENQLYDVLKLFPIKDLKIQFNDIPFPINKIFNNIYITKLFGNKKNDVFLNFKLDLNLKDKNEKGYNYFNYSSNIKNVFNFSCNSNVIYENSFKEMKLVDSNCSLFGKNVFNQIFNFIAKESKKSVKSVKKEFISNIQKTENKILTPYNKYEIKKFILKPEGFIVYMNPSEPLKIYDMNTNKSLEYFASSNFKFIANPNPENSKSSIAMQE